MFAQIALFCTPLCASPELNVREYLMKTLHVDRVIRIDCASRPPRAYPKRGLSRPRFLISLRLNGYRQINFEGTALSLATS